MSGLDAIYHLEQIPFHLCKAHLAKHGKQNKKINKMMKEKKKKDKEKAEEEEKGAGGGGGSRGRRRRR